MSNLYKKDPINIDHIKCVEAGKVLSSYQPLVEKHIWSDWDLEAVLTFKLVFISICHDFNWDFLQNTLATIFNSDKDKLRPSYLSQITSATLTKWLSSYDKPERIRAAERSKLIRSIGDGLLNHFDGSAMNLLNKSDGTLMGNEGFYSLLDKLSPFQADPLRKKANVLIHDLARERVVDFPDIDKINPAIEYHVMRLYERTGRIFARNKELQNALINGDLLTDWFVKEIRTVASDALIYTAHTAGKTVPDVNYVEWQIARNICKQKDPNCIKPGASQDGLPEDVSDIFEGSCPYIDFCFAYNEDNESLKIMEPIPAKKKSFY
jgi:hypothetical protein